MSGQVHQDCPNKNNPFHECIDRCFERISLGDVFKEKKKSFVYGMLARRKETPPSSPARVFAENKSLFSSSYAKKVVVEPDESPSFSSSDDAFNENLFTPRSPLQYEKKADSGNSWLPMSPSFSDYCKKDYIVSRFEQREGKAPIHDDVDDEMSPKSRPKTPEHPLRTPLRRPRTPEHRSRTNDNNISLETRPRTPKRESIALEPRSRASDTRPRTPEHRARSPDYKARSETPEPLARTPEPHMPRMQTQPISHRSLENAGPKSPWKVETPLVSHMSLDNIGLKPPQKVKTRPRPPNIMTKTLESMPKGEEYIARPPDHKARSPRPESRTAEPRPRTPGPGSRIPQTQPTSFNIHGYHSTNQASRYHGKMASMYTPDKEEEECVLLDPELLLSPQKSPSSRPFTSKRHQEFDQLDERESISVSDNFSYLDDHDDDSVYLFPEIATPLHPKSRKSSNKQSNDPPELPDKCQSVTLYDIERMKALKIYEKAEETESMISDSYVSIGSYKVKSSVSHTLKQILNKHGDIASGSKLQSLTTTSYYLETLAFVVLELQSTPLKKLKEKRVLEMLAVVKDVESAKMRAGWLKEVLKEILEAVKHYDRRETNVMEKEVYEQDVLLERQEMEKVLKEVRVKEKEVKEFRKGVVETAARLSELEMKRARLEKRLAFLSSKVDKFVGKSVLENVL